MPRRFDDTCRLRPRCSCRQLAHRAYPALYATFFGQHCSNTICVVDRRQIFRRNEPNPNLVNGNGTMLSKNLLDRTLHGNRQVL